MKAKIEPLEGKYYGTRITLENGEGITIWVMGDYKPSIRQLEELSMTYEEAKDDDYFCDSHFESETSFKVAVAIVETLSRIEEIENG